MAECLVEAVRTALDVQSGKDPGTTSDQVTKGPGSRAVGLAMAFKIVGSAQTRWRAVTAPQAASSSNDPMTKQPDPCS